MNNKERMRQLMDQLAREMGEIKEVDDQGNVKEFTTDGKRKLTESEEDLDEESDQILNALANAYLFISQPQKMQSRPKGPTIITYHTSRYNEITSELRAAIAVRKGE